MKTVAIIQARLSSTRLQGKVLMELAGLPVLGWCVRAAKAIHGVDEVIVATSEDVSDDTLAAWCASNQVICIRGPLQDVLGRYVLAAKKSGAQIIMRLTSDCPLLDPHVCAEVLQLFHLTGSDYVSNVVPRVWPDGTDCEVFSADTLYFAHEHATRKTDREHVTSFIRNNQQRFKVQTLSCPLPGLGSERWTLDTKEDLKFLQTLTPHLPKGRAPSYTEVLSTLNKKPELRQKVALPAAAIASLPQEPPSFATSKALLEDALELIPQGSQTYSKSVRQFPVGHAPLFLTHGEGGQVWDVDGNVYVDMICGLLPVVLGYADPDVDYAIREQLSHGISFSLPTVLETELAKRLVKQIPCAEKVRFAKNGSDVTSAAIRIARAHTGRDRIMVCGYHGWQDWYIGSTSRHKGVPAAVSALTHTVPYNDLAAIEAMLVKHKGEFAALIMEPVNTTLPQAGYLQSLKDLLHKHGVLLIFDEVITGFRLAKGGAQDYFGVTPDLAAFGKAMGNGMPISAVVGRSDILDEMDQIFFSGTFGGEALSLAAAIAVIDKMNREPVIETLWKTGEQLNTGVNVLLKQYGLENVLILRGLAPWIILDFQPQSTASREAIKTLFVTQMARHGVLILGSHNVCYAHSETQVLHVLAAYDATLKHIAAELASGHLEKNLPCPAIYPAFSVR